MASQPDNSTVSLSPGISKNLNKGKVFKNQESGLVTQDVALSNDWRRYQIALNDSDLKDVTHPFGFILTGGNTAFSLKGVTYDTNTAEDPLALDQTLSNGTDLIAGYSVE